MRLLFHRFHGCFFLRAFTLCVPVIGVEIKVVVSAPGRAAQTVSVVAGLSLKAKAFVARETLPALAAHSGKALQESALPAQTVYDILKFFPKRLAFQFRLMIKPAGPKRMIISIAMMILSFFVYSGWLLYKHK